MAALLDTSVLVRYLTLHPPEQAKTAQALIESAETFSISVVALAEAGYVLTRLYGVERAAAVDLLVRLVGRRNLSVLEIPAAHAVEALLLCRPSGRVSFADALMWALAKVSGAKAIVTFDRHFPAAGIERRLLK